MAGTDPGFNATEFRNAIHFAMSMGTPTKPSERVKFRWRPHREYAHADVANRPYNWTAPTTVDIEHPDVEVLVGVEFSSRAQVETTAVGGFEQARLILTLLDSEYELVKTATQVVVDGDIYAVLFTGPPTGLFDVTVYRMYCQPISGA